MAEIIPVTQAPRPRKIPSDPRKIIRELGLKITQQRCLILETLQSRRDHLTAQEVFELVSAKCPQLGFATVYRFLKTLSEHKFVTEVRMGGLPARYEWADKAHHDHLTCTRCGEIQEFENENIERLQEMIAMSFSYILLDHVLELYGLCPKCQNEPTPPSA